MEGAAVVLYHAASEVFREHAAREAAREAAASPADEATDQLAELMVQSIAGATPLRKMSGQEVLEAGGLMRMSGVF